jgi:Tfp pilus assembly ATPase PilU
MQTMNQSLFDLAIVKKVITVDEAMARTGDADELKTMIANSTGQTTGGSGANARRRREN